MTPHADDRFLRRAAMALLLAGATLPGRALTTAGDSLNYLVTPSSPAYGLLSGVVRIEFFSEGLYAGLCTGALLQGGTHVLTAAHCLTGESPDFSVDAFAVSAPHAGWLAQGDPVGIVRDGNAHVHTDWNGDFYHGADIAVVQLAAPAPLGLARYGIMRYPDDKGCAGAPVTDPPCANYALFAGYGLGGLGPDGGGAQDPNWPTDWLTWGYNSYDEVWDIPGEPYKFDFDNGQEAQNSVGSRLNTGVVPSIGDVPEVFNAPGDSGGPSFYDNIVVGVHSFRNGKPDGVAADIDAARNSSFGELGADTRVGFYADWIDRVTSPVPEIGTGWMLAAGLAAAALSRRRRGPGTAP